jgi:hypothetical protein
LGSLLPWEVVTCITNIASILSGAFPQNIGLEQTGLPAMT